MSSLILFHIGVALSALLLGALVLARRKGTPSHRLLGRLSAIMLAATALSSFWIASPSFPHWHGLGPIHVLSLITLATLTRAVLAIRAGKVPAHRRMMIGAYLGLLAAGIATLLPARLLGQMVFG